MKENSITILDILKGILFSLILFLLGYLINLTIEHGLFEAVYFIISNLKSKIILTCLLILVVIVGALISTLSTSIEYGLPIHKILKKDNKK